MIIIRRALSAVAFINKQRILLLALLLYAQASITQSTDFNFINFSNEDGLLTNTVNAIYKDKYGYMWFGTDDGLNRFDGETFTVYRHKPGDSTSISANRINAICGDRMGNLWIGTSESLSFYDRKKDAFTNYYFDKEISVRALCIDHLGNLWIGSYTGLLMMDMHTSKVIRYNVNPAQNDQLLSKTIVSLFEDSHHRLWVGTNEGLHLYNWSKNNFTRFQHVAADSFSIADNAIRTMAEDMNGNLWIGTNDGISQLLPGEKGFKNFRPGAAGNKTNKTFNSNRIWAIASDYEGKLWIGTEGGINIFDTKTNEVSSIVRDPRNKYSLTGKSVRSIYVDGNGVCWVGIFQGGISKYDKNLAFFNLRQSNSFDSYGLSAPIVTSFIEDIQGDIYVGTDGGGLNHYHRKTGLFCHPELTTDTGNKPLTVLAMERVGNDIWIGTYGMGLYVLNMQTNKVSHYKKGNGPDGLSGNDIFCLKKDRNGNIWIGNNGSGVDVFKPGTGIIHHFDKTLSDVRTRLPLNGYIRAIEEDEQGNIWIGSNGTGIAIYNSSSESFKQINRINSHLSSNSISTIYIDRKGIVWIGTDGGGLSRIDKNGKMISYSEADGLSNAVIHKILEGDNGKLWISTNKGISSFDERTEKFKNYSYQNGLQKSMFSTGAGLKASNGDLFFGGVDGFNFFNPAHLPTNRIVPSLIFTDLKISNRSIVPGPKEAIKENISVAKEVTLGYKESFSLDFVALNYTDPQENRYSYKLDGFDKDWNNVGTLRKAGYTNLDPGHYTFRLRAESEDGMWRSPETSIHIYVKPPFWLTVYAYIIYAFLIGCFLISWRYWGIRKLKNKFAVEQERLQFQQMIEQERKDAEQKHELDNLKIKFLTNLSHEFRTPVSLILAPAEELLESKANASNLNQLSLITRNAKRLLNLVDQLLDFRKLEENELQLNPAEGDLISFVKEVGDSFKDISERKHINFAFSGSISHYYTSFDKGKIERILFNLLSNAFKFTKEGGRICLDIGEDTPFGIRITVTDTGIGMTKDVQEKIFERFFRGNAHPGIMNQGNGIGLSITKEFVKLHGGAIRVESTPGKGSAFIIRLPFKQMAMPIEEPVKQETAEESYSIVDSDPATIGETPLLEKPTILLIEDHEDFRHYLSSNLGAHYTVVEAANGKQGWQKALSSHPKVIVSDISMPEMDGIVLCRKIKSDKRTSHIPIILLTALTGDTNQLIGLNTGANDYLTKPFNFEILNVKINNLLRLNQNLKNVYSRQLKLVTPDIEVQSSDEKLLVKITQYIESNIDSPDLSVEELSRQVHMSRGSLYNKILNLTGEAPGEFIRSFKLDKAAALLENSDMKITQIGYTVGFPTPNYFTRAFKAKFNMSPSEYMKLKRKPQ